MDVDVFIPVRMTSSRLPGKALRIINDKPILKYLLERVQKAKKIRKIIVCTTINKSDDKLIGFLNSENVEFFRGSEHDILTRYLDAANKFGTKFIVNVEGDDIYTDPICIDKIVEEFENTDADYLDIQDMPLGLSPSGIKIDALKIICSIKKTNNTETGYKSFFTSTNLFHTKHIKLVDSLIFPNKTRLTLDYQEDLELAKEIFNEIGNDFHKKNICDLFQKRPELVDITNGLEEKYYRHYTQNLTDINTKDM